MYMVDSHIENNVSDVCALIWTMFFHSYFCFVMKCLCFVGYDMSRTDNNDIPRTWDNRAKF